MRRAALVGVIAVSVLLLGVLVLPFLVDVNHFRPAIQSAMTRSLGREVRIGDLHFSIWSGTVTASDLSIVDDPAFGQQDFLRAKTLKLSINPWQAAFSRKLNVKGVSIDSPDTVLTQAPSGMWNFSSLGVKASAQSEPSGTDGGSLALSIKSLTINGARLTVTRPGAKPEILDNVSIDVKDFAPSAVFPFSLSAKIAGGGEIALDGKAGPLDPADTANTPLTASLKITNLNLAASGAVPGSLGIDGLVSVDGTVNSNGRTVETTGQIKAERVKLAPRATAARSPLTVDVALTEDTMGRTGQITRGDVSIGSVKASLTGTWSEQGAARTLNLILAAPNIPVSGLEELLAALDIVLPSGSTLEGGTATARFTLTGPMSAVVTAGPVSVQNTRLKGFDFGARMSPIAALAGIKSGPSTEIQTLSANMRMASEETSLQDIRLVLPAVGEVTGDGIISPSHSLNFKMRAMARSSGIVSALAPATIAFSVGGTASDPQFRPDLGQLASEELKERLKGVKVGGVDAGKAAGSVLQDLFGDKKKKK
jgi:AsmA protein